MAIKSDVPDNRMLKDEWLSHITGGRSIDGYVEYTVMHGDDLPRIAQKYHVSAKDIAVLNGLQVSDVLFVGQLLNIPVRIR